MSKSKAGTTKPLLSTTKPNVGTGLSLYSRAKLGRCSFYSDRRGTI
jgi:hypothetical protein